jgi:Domain of unknown function (DUF4190)
VESDNWNFAPGGTPKQVGPADLPSSPTEDPPRVQPPAPPTPVLSGQPGQRVVYAPQAQQPTNGMATASLVLGILGMFVPILGVLALVFGSIGISRANQGASGKGMAVAGLVLGVLGTLVMLYIAGGGNG